MNIGQWLEQNGLAATTTNVSIVESYCESFDLTVDELDDSDKQFILMTMQDVEVAA